MAESASVQEFLHYVVNSVVSHPDDVRIDELEDGRGTTFELSLHQEDLEALNQGDEPIGQALRTVLDACAYKHRARVQLVILGDDAAEEADEDDE